MSVISNKLMRLIPENKHYKEPSVFTPENLLREARRQKNLADCNVPEVCVLDPDGDLVAYLIKTQGAAVNPCWACYHTTLYHVKHNGKEFGILGNAVGASFAVLIAEQLFATGCKTLISITSAGILNPGKKHPQFILIDQALRDEGTSYHYLPPSETSNIHPSLLDKLMAYYHTRGLLIENGMSWTTDAPYRETQAAIDWARSLNAIAVEMEAAALYAFSKAKNQEVICFAHLTNTMAQMEGDFEKGEEMGSLDTLELIQHTMNALDDSSSQYWNKIYSDKKPDEVSWTQEVPKTSLDFIHSFQLSKSAKIIDVGGGDSKLVDFLLEEGYENLTVLDISATALEKAKKRLGSKAEKVIWVVSDITQFEPDGSFDVWHDRAAFHFLTNPEQIDQYREILRKAAVRYVIIGTFSEEGPLKCSSLNIKQYNESSLNAVLKNNFDPLQCLKEDHLTPFKTVQNFLFCSFKRRNESLRTE